MGAMKDLSIELHNRGEGDDFGRGYSREEWLALQRENSPELKEAAAQWAAAWKAPSAPSAPSASDGIVGMTLADHERAEAEWERSLEAAMVSGFDADLTPSDHEEVDAQWERSLAAAWGPSAPRAAAPFLSSFPRVGRPTGVR